jgi:hypothetical protein
MVIRMKKGHGTDRFRFAGEIQEQRERECFFIPALPPGRQKIFLQDRYLKILIRRSLQTLLHHWQNSKGQANASWVGKGLAAPRP